jgi:hypothetical protein
LGKEEKGRPAVREVEGDTGVGEKNRRRKRRKEEKKSKKKMKRAEEKRG